MLLQGVEQQIFIIFILTFVLIIIKVILLTFLGVKIYQRTRETGEFSFGFVFGVFVLVACLLASRIIYSIFDFYLTGLDPTKFYEPQNAIVWKIASFINILGYAYFIYKTDQKALNFKFKGIFAIILLIVAAVQIVYPVSTADDFYVVSILGVASNVVAILIPIFFFYLARNPSPYRKAALFIAVGAIIYAIGANIPIENILAAIEAIFGYESRIFMFLLSVIFKAVGLTMFSWGISDFTVKFSK